MVKDAIISNYMDQTYPAIRERKTRQKRNPDIEGVNRFKGMWSKTPPAMVLQFAERVVMHKSKLSPRSSTATSYCWIVWKHDHTGVPEQGWIGPCRKRLERASDYEGYV